MRKLFLALSTCALGACGKDPAPPAPTTATTAPPATAAPHDHDKAGHDHDKAAHDHAAPHGGIVQTAGKYHIEAVASKVGMLVYLTDEAEKALPIDDVKGTVLLSKRDGKAPTEAAFEPMGNHLHAMVGFDGPWTAVVTLNVKGETLTARFEGGAPGAGHDHGGAHDHGAHDHGGGAHDHAAMPQMRLSDTVEGRVGPIDAAAPIEAKKPVVLGFDYRVKADGPDAKALADFEVVHEQKLHVFIVSDDLSRFWHEHPAPADAAMGTWTLPMTFDVPGTYHVYSDFKSTSAGANVTRNTLTVAGEAPAPTPLTVDTAMTKTFGDLTATLTLTPSPLTTGDALLSYTFSDAAGQPVKDLSPYLGAFGHLFILKEDKLTMAHAHPQGAEPTPEMRSGPEVKFHTQLPSPGRYKLWAQVQRGATIITTDWTVEVK